jgi:hypothetical protein
VRPELIGKIAGLIVLVSALPYAVRVFQKKIQPNLVSWSIWSIIGLALLLTYQSSGAGSNIWPAVFGCFNPILITVLALWRGMRRKPERWELVCGAIGITALMWWSFVRNEASQAQFALYLAIVADAGAAVPTIGFVWKHPHEDRPFMWGMFGVGYGLGMFAITDQTIPNYVLPVYMTITASTIAVILAVYRLRNRLPLKEWI